MKLRRVLEYEGQYEIDIFFKALIEFDLKSINREFLLFRKSVNKHSI